MQRERLKAFFNGQGSLRFPFKLLHEHGDLCLLATKPGCIRDLPGSQPGQLVLQAGRPALGCGHRLFELLPACRER